SNSAPALRTGLAIAAQVMLVIAHFAECGAAIDVHLARLAGFQPQVGINALARGERHRASGAARELSALAGLHLDVVHDRAHRNVAQRHGVAGLDRRIRSGADLIALLDALWRQNVAALTVRVLDQGDVARPVRVVLQALDDSGDTVLVALEID